MASFMGYGTKIQVLRDVTSEAKILLCSHLGLSDHLAHDYNAGLPSVSYVSTVVQSLTPPKLGVTCSIK